MDRRASTPEKEKLEAKKAGLACYTEHIPAGLPLGHRLEESILKAIVAKVSSPFSP